MPHFCIDCSEEILKETPANEILESVYQAALSTDLFAKKGISGIKVRINPFKHYITSDQKTDFIHVFAHIMEGRDEAQKKNLSHKVVKSLAQLLPLVPIISLSVLDIEKASYSNKGML